MNLETQKHTKRIEIHQSQITNLHLLKLLFPKRSVKMIDGSEKRKLQLVFELQSSCVYEKRSQEQRFIPFLHRREEVHNREEGEIGAKM